MHSNFFSPRVWFQVSHTTAFFAQRKKKKKGIMTTRTAPSPVAPTSLQSSRTDDFAVTPLQLPSHEVATLFRGASVAVKLLSEYGGYVAHSHVREVLQEDLMAVLADTGSYELNPNKVSLSNNYRGFFFSFRCFGG